MSKASSVAKSTGVVSIVTLASRILGMFRDIVIAGFFGAGFITDAFFLAFTIPNLLRRLVAEGSLATAFVPVFTDELEKSKDAARRAISEVTGFSILLTGTLTVLGILFASFLTDIFAPGFAAGSEKYLLTVRLTQVMMPYAMIISLIALASGALNTLGKFALPASAPAILNVVMISAVLLFGGLFKEPVYALAWAVPVGGIAALIPQLYSLYSKGFPMRWSSPFNSEPVRKIALLMLPSIFASSVYQIMVLVNRMLASMLSQGSISWYYFADRLVQFPLGVFSIALATAILPQLSKLASRGEKEKFNKQLLDGLNWTSFVIVPASVGLIVLAEPLVSAIYAYGKFQGNDIPSTAKALQAFSVGLLPVSLYALVVRAFLAKKNTILPAGISSLTIAINILLAIAFMGTPASIPSDGFAGAIAQLQTHIEILSIGHIGLALAGSCSSLINLVILGSLLSRIETRVNWLELISVTLRAIVCSILMTGVITICSGPIDNSILTLLVSVPVGALSYFYASLVFRSPEARQTLEIIKSRKLFSR